MNPTDRIALVAACWFVLWTAVGYHASEWILLEGSDSGLIAGFVFAFLSSFGWPQILPRFILNWMDGE
jgi:hypothetical protein